MPNGQCALMLMNFGNVIGVCLLGHAQLIDRIQ